MTNAYVRELFLSIQGEGPYVGEQQLFIRFCGCNLNCGYCDTDFVISKSEPFTPEELFEKVRSFGENLTVSLTGGEPLVSVSFLQEFLPLLHCSGYKVYLETNGTLPEQLSKVINVVDVVSADIKLKSTAGVNVSYEIIDKFFKIACEKEVFAKVVFDNNITDEEIAGCVRLAKKYDIEIILQPKMQGDDFGVSTDFVEKVFDKFVSKYRKVRLIPQVHKFLKVR